MEEPRHKDTMKRDKMASKDKQRLLVKGKERGRGRGRY